MPSSFVLSEFSPSVPITCEIAWRESKSSVTSPRSHKNLEFCPALLVGAPPTRGCLHPIKIINEGASDPLRLAGWPNPTWRRRWVHNYQHTFLEMISWSRSNLSCMSCHRSAGCHMWLNKQPTLYRPVDGWDRSVSDDVWHEAIKIL